MGWLPSFFGGSKPAPADPLANLPPNLRTFYDSETPRNFASAAAEDSPTTPRKSAVSEAGLPTSGARPRTTTSEKLRVERENEEKEKDVPLPKESLFQDGRYKDIWKTYRPMKEVEEEGKTVEEKMADVLVGFKNKRELIGRAALENCVDLEGEWQACLRSGSWADRATLCRDQIRAYDRCFNLQHRFLRTLGYLADPSKPQAFHDVLQIHADTLYRKVVAHEEAVLSARSAGLPEPKWVDTPISELAIPGASASMQNVWEKHVVGSDDVDGSLEEAANQADREGKELVGRTVVELRGEASREMEEKIKQGRGGLIAMLLGKVNGVGKAEEGKTKEK